LPAGLESRALMSTLMSLEQFAALVDTPEDELREWAAVELLNPAGDGVFDELDLLRLMTVRHYKALGYNPDQLAEALSSGEVTPFQGEYLYPRDRPLSLEEAADRIGIDPEMLRSLRVALGFRRTDSFLKGDLQLLESFKVIAAAGLPPEAVLEGARVFGDTLRRLAETETRLVHVHIHERLEAEGIAEEEISRQIAGLTDAVVPLLDGIVERLHHEHLVQANIEDAYVHLVPSDAPGGRGSVEATIVFVDVASFTQLAQSEGDQAALDLMTRVDSELRTLALEHDGKVVKQIGDALMLAFRRATHAVGFAAALDERVGRDPSLPPLRTGMHCGPAVYRGGDYIGTTVNLAARVNSICTAGETLITEAVANQAGGAAPLEPVGVRMLRGMEQPLSLYRLQRGEQRDDPVCGMTVSAPPAAQLREGEREVWFCSQQCLRKFLSQEQPDPATPAPL
jgi:adenylate cyclase